jgi:hypothetical protein
MRPLSTTQREESTREREEVAIMAVIADGGMGHTNGVVVFTYFSSMLEHLEKG